MLKQINKYSIFILVLMFGGIIFYYSIMPVIVLAKTHTKYKNYYYVGERNPIAQCKFRDDKPCGANLYGCTSGREYFCITNLWTKEK